MQRPEQNIQKAVVAHLRQRGVPGLVEEWRGIPSWEGYYEVSSLGRVRRARSGQATKIGRVLRSFVDGRGYNIIQLSIRDRHQTVRVSRLVAEAFVAGFSHGMQVDHIDGCRTDNRPENLRMVTNDQNAKNRSIYKNNPMGVKGVSLRKGRYVARIQVDKKRLALGYFTSLAGAVAAYKAAEQKFFGEFARGGPR